MYKKIKLIYLILFYTNTINYVLAEETQLAKATQEIHNKLYPTITIPLYAYNNRNLGINNSTNQAEFQLEPRLPITISDNLKFILNPQFTYDSNKTNEIVTNFSTPIQISSYFALHNDSWDYGIGPYIQSPSANSNNGTKQTGLGGSWGVFYKPKNWVVGSTGYIEWGIGNNLSGGTANNLNFSPAITYVTDQAWAFTLNSKINSAFYQGKTLSTNQLLLSGAKSHKIFDIPIQLQIGPTYWITTTPTSPKGVGAFIGITGNYQL